MGISEFHASHIRKVCVTFTVSGPDLDSARVSERLGQPPDEAHRRGDEWRNRRTGFLVGHRREGCWSVSTSSRVDSKDVNDHLRWLLARLLPHRDVILDLAAGGETYFDVLWESTYLYAGTGPLIEAGGLAGVAALGAGMGFDIYQVDEPEEA